MARESTSDKEAQRLWTLNVTHIKRKFDLIEEGSGSRPTSLASAMQGHKIDAMMA
jgi:hypothetical protein